MPHPRVLDRTASALVVIDVQEAYRGITVEHDRMQRGVRVLIEAAKVLGLPILATEQYPKGLGRTVKQAGLDGSVKPIEKVHFSCFGSGEFVQRIRELGTDTLVIFGIEAHVCVLQTALDAVKRGMNAVVIADAVSSRKKEDKDAALDRMRQGNIKVETAEMVLFQLMDKAGTDEFKKISELVK